MAKYNSMDEVPKRIKKNLAKYFTNVGGENFAIRGLPSELTGALLARYSRASTGLQLTYINEFADNNGKPSAEKGSELMDRVLNAFGDDSVGELEGAHIGIENISQLLTKEIEDRRIGGSPIEQSTRYVKYDKKDAPIDKKDGDGRWRYLRVKEIMQSGLGDKFEAVNNGAFEVYSEGIGKLQDYFKQQFPRNKFQIEVERFGQKLKVYEHELIDETEKKAFANAYAFTIRCAALDVGRCVLPASTLTHMGIFGNGRFYTNLLTHLWSSELSEASERADALEIELNKVIPTFIKRGRENIKIYGVAEKRREINRNMQQIADKLFDGIIPMEDYVTLIPRTDYMDEVVSSALYSYSKVSLSQINEVVSKLFYEEKEKILKTYAGRRDSRRDRTGRGLEAGYPIVFDLLSGFAEYRDLERHRILTQQRQDLSTDLGFIIPPEIIEIGLEEKVKEVESRMSDLNSDLKRVGLKEVSQYATLFNHRMRFMLGMNLRENQHLEELRTGPAGHFSYRAMTQEMARQLIAKYPWTEIFLEYVDYSDPNNKISRANEQAKIARKNVDKNVDGSIDLE